MGGRERWAIAQQWVFLVGLVALLAAAPAVHAATKPQRIVGGNIVTSPEEAPWSVLVSARDAEGTTLCSGSIIAPDRVLTAAHCVYDNGGEQRSPGELAAVARLVDRGPRAPWGRGQSRQGDRGPVPPPPEHRPPRDGRAGPRRPA